MGFEYGSQMETQPRDPLVLLGVVLGQAALGGAGVWLLGRSLTFVADLYLGEVRFQSQRHCRQRHGQSGTAALRAGHGTR